MPLPDVAQGDPHVAAHNNERHLINQLETAQEGFVELDGAPTDGQLLVWSSTLGKWTPANPSGNGELAYAENITGTVTSLAVSASGGLGTAVNIPGCSIVVPVSTRPVWLYWGLTFLQNLAGNGSLFVAVKEGATALGNSAFRLPNTTDTTQNTISVRGFTRIGPVAAQKTLLLSAQLYSPTSDDVGGNVVNGSTFDNRSFVSAEAR